MGYWGNIESVTCKLCSENDSLVRFDKNGNICNDYQIFNHQSLDLNTNNLGTAINNFSDSNSNNISGSNNNEDENTENYFGCFIIWIT